MRFCVDAVDAHAQGQHGRVVMGGVGVLNPPGATDRPPLGGPV